MRRPSLSLRTISSPASSQPAATKSSNTNNFNMLTPPSSPPRRIGSSTNLPVEFETLETLRSSVDGIRPVECTKDNIMICPFHVSYLTSADGRSQTFGHGAWSNVFKGTCHSKQHTSRGLITPPLQTVAAVPLLVAVKSPARKDARSILRSEARILTMLRNLDPAEQYITAFHGIIDGEDSLVLNAYPLSLEEHIRDCAKSAQRNTKTENLFDPVIGNMSTWLEFADKLVTALDWLHNHARIIHGDIKPGNVLLKKTPNTITSGVFSYEPLLIDFSSSQEIDTTDVTLNTLSAVTMEYTAPELLRSSVLRDPKSCATTESDVFSAAVTLLVAATGDLLVYTGCSRQQRQMLATQGTSILGTVRSLSTKVPRNGVVSRALEKAVLKFDARIDTKSWKQIIQAMKNDTGNMYH